MAAPSPEKADVLLTTAAAAEVPAVAGEEEEEEAPPPPPFSVFTRGQKRCIVLLVSYASWVSNLSSFIFLPALQPLSDSFAVPVSRINLAVTVYMAVAVAAPALVGDAADVWGRRPAYFSTLSIFVVANVALALAASFAQFLGFRVLQALGQSGIILIAYGVVADIASPAERGTFMSIASFAVTIGPFLGPIIGGALSYGAGWTWIFWFLVLISAPCLCLIALFLPETSRSIVGNGSIQPPTYLKPPFAILQGPQRQDDRAAERHERRVPNPLKSTKMLLRKDNAVLVLAWGLMYCIYSCNITTLATLLLKLYGLSEWQAGLTYLPFALGGTSATLFSGWLLDSAYARARKKRGLSTDNVRGDDLDDFPIEKPRLEVMWLPMVVIVIGVTGYGWTLQYGEHISIPLILQFIVGTALQVNFGAFNTLLTDMNHKAPAAANAATNIVRCALAAIIVAYIQEIIDKVGTGWAFTILGSFCLVSIALMVVLHNKGLSWRRAKAVQCQGPH
ncbi:multidrug resistance protein [Xylariomycetidae sp. FL0641]|nr:multidrug resistance protein [Xylariomycetidae sp. FL0641]